MFVHFCIVYRVNPSDCRGNYSATSNNMKLVHWPLIGGLLHLVQRGGDWAGPSSPSPLLAVPNVTAHLSTASLPITVLLYNVALLCGFNVPTRVKTKLERHDHVQSVDQTAHSRTVTCDRLMQHITMNTFNLLT